MLFNSIQFLIFFPTVVLFYFLLPHSKRWLLLLIASYYFYMCLKPRYALIIFTITLIDYFSAIWIDKAGDKNNKKRILLLSICSNMGILFFFKYFNFFNHSLASFLNFLHFDYSALALNVVLPIGISFHTFQSLSYTIDVYRGRIKAERHFGTFALFVIYFPQLVAGPIERAGNLLHQLHEKHLFAYDRVVSGLRQMLLGFFKKVLIADNLASVVNAVYNNPHDYNALSLAIATTFFAFQIYFDFSGYSDIAIGASRVMGIELMKNFDNPYRSKSIQEFWTRWHISLSTWFKDYLYIPLGGNRVSLPRWCLNIMIVFLVSGLWHGASWTFVIWGALHGIYMVLSRISEKARELTARRIGLANFPRIHAAFKMLITFTLVNFAWIFFRANNIQDAFYIVKKILFDFDLSFNLERFQVAVFSLFILIIETYVLLAGNERIKKLFESTFLRWSLYIVAILMILFFGDFANNKFLYFQF